MASEQARHPREERMPPFLRGLCMACGCTTPLTADQCQDTEDDLLPPYTMEERIRELRQHLVLLRWRAPRLCDRRHPLFHQPAFSVCAPTIWCLPLRTP